ncbi:MAG: NAD(P)-binding domain-containing protein, partial [Calditrichaeota bacterium]|nr:NAD(P)-binding domain-containing protein [Calditrichota bacterium]
MLSKGKFAVIGAGKMGEILISALLDAGSVKKEQFIATAKHTERIDYLAREYGIETTLDNAGAVREANTILLCVKPQNSLQVLEEIRDELTENKLLISIVTSLITTKMETILGKPIPVIRAMPNTPALLKEGITALSGGKYAQSQDLEK